ncbi:PTS sugar transporter subunit IIA [Nocardiopsis sp. YSL2]|uniref:PTS sugar transporter subunit IIA n=1 Tax=Nocardiopsis sp. YSL2 TaxID=2939492 RepID=UPI0026F40A81|nr:PTS sugar transporter subunit IIA [Nocardiopsis sp. YSL2]
MPNNLALTADAVRLGRTAADKKDAIDQCGALLVELGAVEPGYVSAMHEREASVSTFLGEGVAIPHGTDASRALIKETALALVQFPDGVDWDGNTAYLAVGIAASGDEHIGVLSALATVLSDPDRAQRLRSASAASEVLALLGPGGDG